MAELGAGSGSGYPAALDTKQTFANGVSPIADTDTRIDAEVMNDLLDAVVKIQTELGVNPSDAADDAVAAAESATDILTKLNMILTRLKDIISGTDWKDAVSITLNALAAHKARHISGGADAFATTDLLEAIVKRIKESGGTTLTVGAVADGQVVQRSGTDLIGVAAGALKSVQVFTSGGTWNRPAGVTRVQVFVVGGGGGGGGAGATNGNKGGGGGGGGCAISFLDVSAIATSTITIGAAGAAGASGDNDGGAGGDSVWSDGTNTLTGSGGALGPKGSVTVLGGVGGAATNGYVNLSGGRGGPAAAISATNPPIAGEGGEGGGPFGGVGAPRPPITTIGNNGSSFGGGGSGGDAGAGTARAGGVGAAGIVVVWEYS